MRGEIYQLASRVIVWLGHEENQSDSAMNMLAVLGSQITLDLATFSIKPSEGASDGCISDITAELSCSESELTCIYHLLQRSWFDRLWVRQEILLANDAAIFVCGFHVVPWQTSRSGLACVYLKRCKNFRFQHAFTDRLDVLRSLLFGE